MDLVYLHYKEPLKKVENGYGFLGTLAQTEDGTRVQCHECGELFYNLGAHARQAHNLLATEYRNKYQLNRRTPLCSDKASEEYKERALRLWNSKTEEEKEHQKELMRNAQELAIRVGRPIQLEQRNKEGMCPDQLLEKIRVLSDEIGESPSSQQFLERYDGRFMFTIVRTFGSWNNAKSQLGLSPCKSGQRVPHNKGLCKFTDEELLSYLSNHYKRTGTPPTSTDWKRYYFPDYHIYLRKFGSIKEARRLAGIPVEKPRSAAASAV